MRNGSESGAREKQKGFKDMIGNRKNEEIIRKYRTQSNKYLNLIISGFLATTPFT